MIAIHQLTRFLAGLGEIVNILTAPIVAALAYLAAMERFMGEGYMGRHMDDQMMNDQMMMSDPTIMTHAVNQDMAIFTSIIIAVVAVGFINGGFAVLFNMRRILADGQKNIKRDDLGGLSNFENLKTKDASNQNVFKLITLEISDHKIPPQAQIILNTLKALGGEDTQTQIEDALIKNGL